MEEFKEKIAEILEVDNVDLNQELESFECWDSLTVLSIIALSDEMYDVTLSANEINNSNTVKRLQDLIKSKM